MASQVVLRRYSVAAGPTFEDWRKQARSCLSRGFSPDEIDWIPADSEQAPLFALEDTPLAVNPAGRVPREFIELAEKVAYHRDPSRWALLYRVLWRLNHGELSLLELAVDPDISALRSLERQVRLDLHKTHAFVRFRKSLDTDGEERWIAWHRPDNPLIRLAAPFFARRFASMRWSILTPDESAHWDGESLKFGPGTPSRDAPPEDSLEDLWRTYYSSTFNPARIKVRAMKKELPPRHWPTLPEARVIEKLLRESPERLREMRLAHDRTSSAQAYLPEIPENAPDPIRFSALREAAFGCRACGICESATQTVWGEGPLDADIVLVGEQPGDEEDQAGRPFVGPAGQLLDRALAQAGLDRSRLYLTNAVKHFKWRPEGKRRLHQRPSGSEIAACKPWLENELALVRPRTLICLGVSAAQSVLGRAIKLSDERGRPHSTEWTPDTWVTTHPSAILRQPDPDGAETEFKRLVEDLRRASGI